jgi:hypothetical protein
MRFVELSRWLEVNTNEVGGLLKKGGLSGQVSGGRPLLWL